MRELTTEDTGGTERGRHRELTGAIIESALIVHKSLGPGLLESVYEKCLAFELVERGYDMVAQREIPLIYRNLRFESGFRADLIVESRVLVELKAIDFLLPVHQAQVLTYLKLSSLRAALPINFNVPFLRDGLKRISL